MSQSDLIGVAAIGILGAILYKKMSGLGGGVVTAVRETYIETIDRTKEVFRDIKDTTTSFIPAGLTPYVEKRPVYVAAAQVPDSVKAPNYEVGGYGDVAKIGTGATGSQDDATKSAQDWAAGTYYVEGKGYIPKTSALPSRLWEPAKDYSKESWYIAPKSKIAVVPVTVKTGLITHKWGDW